jgi:hypothetical protein
MKKLFGLLIMWLMICSFSAKAQNKPTETKKTVKAKLEVYYFHGDRK